MTEAKVQLSFWRAFFLENEHRRSTSVKAKGLYLYIGWSDNLSSVVLAPHTDFAPEK